MASDDKPVEVDAVMANPPMSELPFYTPANIAKVVARELAKDGGKEVAK